MSVLFSNTRTLLLYNEREIFNTARSEADNLDEHAKNATDTVAAHS